MIQGAILVVKDDDIIRGSVSRILRAQGQYVLEARDGVEGLGLAREFQAQI